MLTLSTPETLFSNKKLFHINGSAEEKFSKPAHFKVAMLYENPEPELPETLKSMAVKMLQACQFKPEDAIFINLKNENNISFGALLNRYNPEVVLIFGNIKAGRNMAELKKNIPYAFGKLKMLRTETLDNLEKNGQEKQALWVSLKKMLGL